MHHAPNRFGDDEMGYEHVMGAPPSKKPARPPGGQDPQQQGGAGAQAAGGAPHAFEDVPLGPKRRGGSKPHANAYRLKVFTADRLNAGLGNTTVRGRVAGDRPGVQDRHFCVPE